VSGNSSINDLSALRHSKRVTDILCDLKNSATCIFVRYRKYALEDLYNTGMELFKQSWQALEGYFFKVFFSKPVGRAAKTSLFYIP